MSAALWWDFSWQKATHNVIWNSSMPHKISQNVSNGTDTNISTFNHFDINPNESKQYFQTNVFRGGVNIYVVSPVVFYNNYTNSTIVGIHGVDGNHYVMSYNHTTGVWSDRYYVGANDWVNAIESTGHFIRDSAGKLHLFSVSGGLSGVRHFVSNNSDDISSWTNKGRFWCAGSPDSCIDATGGAAEETLAIKSNDGTIYYFSSTSDDSVENNRYWGFVKSTDNGNTWSTVTSQINNSNPHWAWVLKPYYQNTSNNEGVHITWGDYGGSGALTGHKDLYYAFYNISNGHLYNASGSDLGLSTDLNNTNARVRTTGTNVSPIHIGVADSNGTPYILWNEGTPTDSSFFFTMWNGSAWITPQIIVSGLNDVWRPGDLVAYNSSYVEAYIETNNAVEEWIYNGGTWSKAATIYSGDTTASASYAPYASSNPFSEILKITFAEGVTNNVNKAWAWGKYGFLPSDK